VWSWDLGKPIFFTSTGALSQAIPSTGFVQQVGVPRASDILGIQIHRGAGLMFLPAQSCGQFIQMLMGLRTRSLDFTGN